MKSLLYLILLFSLFPNNIFTQQSSLVYPGTDNKLVYTKYANTGEDTVIHRVPDFSYAGYKMGGVKLPEIPVVKILEPISGDNRSQIQSAINEVSALLVNQNGFRGAILLKNGKYDCSGPVYIEKSGIVLRGEGQNYEGDGGTRIHATATYQYNLINIRGTEYNPTSFLPHLDTIYVPQRLIEGTDTTDGNIWLKANVTDALKTGASGTDEVSFWLTANNDEFSSYQSKEGTNKPYLEITFQPTGSEIDSILQLIPADDTYARGGENADVNYGDRALLEMKNQGYNNNFTRESFLKFIIPAIDGELLSATLNLWCSNAGNNAIQEHYVTHISDDNWDENTLTFNLQPTTGYTTNTITTTIVPVGSTSFEIDNTEGYTVGDKINIIRTPNQAWIDDLQMRQYGWVPGDYIVSYENRITAVQNNQITVDIPVVQAIDAKYGGGHIIKVDYPNRIVQCGVENMLITSQFTHEEDEAHGWTSIKLENTENCWVKNVTAKNFGYSCVELSSAYRTTIEDCAMLDPVSITTGSRKYSFNINSGSFNLFQRCYTRGGRHDFVTGARVAGPNVFLDCLAENTLNDIGPHHRYATGILFDNIHGGQMRVQNRKDMGTGHGWAGAQTMFWNLETMDNEIKVESPKGAMNWGIGCSGYIQSGTGYWEQWSQPVLPRSLYLQQLKDRLGDTAINNITIPSQSDGTIYLDLEIWGGIGNVDDRQRRPYKELSVPGVIEFEDFDIGANTVTYFDETSGNLGMTYRNTDVDIFNETVLTETTTKNIIYVGEIRPGEWLEYTLPASVDNFQMSLHYSVWAEKQKIVVFLNEEVQDTILLPQTTGKNRFEQFIIPGFNLAVQGESVLRIEFLGESMSFDLFELAKPNTISRTYVPSSKILLYPNPCMDRLYINNIPLLSEVFLYSIEGRRLDARTSTDQNNLQLDTFRLNKGCYLIKVKEPGGNLQTASFLKL